MGILLIFMSFIAVVSAVDYFGQASGQFVKIMTNYKMPNVDAAKASSEANKFVTDLSNYPAFRSIINQASGEKVDVTNMSQMKSMGLKYASQGLSAYSQFQAGPSYSPYVKYVSQHITDFDVSRMVQDGTVSAERYWPLVKHPVSSVMNDPQFKQLASTASSYGKKFVQDAGLQTYLQYFKAPKGYAQYNYEGYGGYDGAYGGDDSHEHYL